MRHCGIARSANYLETKKKVPLNTVVLPPIVPNVLENGTQLLVVNKSKSGAVNGELLTVRSQDVSPRSQDAPKNVDNIRIAQLEQNIKFLQEQHKLILDGLHAEIESLRNRNRELQFQLIFMKGSLPSSPSSSEDDSKHKVYVSPKQPNITPLQIELLERDIGELKIQQQEVESRNTYLSAIVDEQKRKLERYEREMEKERDRVVQSDPELQRKLDDAEAIIRRLQRENVDFRRDQTQHYQTSPRADGNFFHNRENQGQRGGSYNNGAGSLHHRGGRGNNRRGSGNGGYKSNNWFPPLHTQNYWHENQGGGRRQNGGEKSRVADENTLPNVHHQGDSGTGVGAQFLSSRRGGNNNHYHNGDGKKFKGGGIGGGGSGQNRGIRDIKPS